MSSAIFATVSRYKVPVEKGSWPDGTPPKQQPSFSGSSPLPAVVAPSPVPSGQDASVEKHYGPGPHRGTGSPQTVHGKKRHRGVQTRQVDLAPLVKADHEYNDMVYPEKQPDETYSEHFENVERYKKARDAARKRRTVPAGAWRKGTVYQLADPESMGLVETDKGWRPELVGTRSKLSARQERVIKRVEAVAPGIIEWANNRGVSIVFSQNMQGYGASVGEFLITPRNGPTIWILTAENAFRSYGGSWPQNDRQMADTLLHELGHVVDWDGTAEATFISPKSKFVSKPYRGKYKLAGHSPSFDYDYKLYGRLNDWYEGESDQIKAKYRYGYGGPPLITEWFAEGFEHYAKDGTTGNDEYDAFIESGLSRFDDLPVKVSKKRVATPSGLTDEEAAELIRLSEANTDVPIWEIEGRNPRSQLDLYRAISKKGDGSRPIVEKHYGPGPHPGTGSPQLIHSEAGRRKIKASIDSVRWMSRNRDKSHSFDEFVDFNVSLAPDDEVWVYAWEKYRKDHHDLIAEKKAMVEAYLDGQLVRPDHPLIHESWGRTKRDKISGLSSDLSEVGSEIMADNPWDEHGWGDEYGPNYSEGTFSYPEGFDAETWGAYVKDWNERKLVEIEEAADAATREIIDNSDVYIQIHRATLPEILEDGGFTTIHSQEAVGAIGEDFGTSHRLAYEEDTFGITPGSVPPNMRPIYGYLWDSDDKDGAVIPENGLNLANPRTALMKYGTVAVRLKPEVRDRTTFTFGDSYSLNMAVLPQPINDPTWLSHGFLSGIVGTGMIEGGARKPSEGMGWNKGWSYIEAQVHGGVTLDDIAEIIVDTPDAVERHQEYAYPRDWVTEWSELETMLNESGVPWRITERALP